MDTAPVEYGVVQLWCANIFLCVQIFFCAGDERQYGVLLPAAARLRLKLRAELGHAGHGVSRQPVLLQVTPSHHREKSCNPSSKVYPNHGEGPY